MDENISFSVLEIEKTKDRQVIQNAYRSLLVKVNPEDDPEGFKRLREAYEQACAYADREEALEKPPETPIEIWMEKVKAVYASLSRRLDLDCWKELLEDEVCLDLDSSVEARDALLGFVAQSYRLTTDVYKMFDRVFNLQEERQELLERFHPNFVEFVMHQCQSDDNFPYEQFEGADDADYDTFLYHYYELCRRIDSGDGEGAGNILDTLEHMPIRHPYLLLEQARYARLKGDTADAAARIHRLFETNGDDMRVQVYGAEILWDNGERELCAEYFEKVLKECPTHYMANKYMAMYYQKTGEYEKAKKYCVEALRISSQEDALLECMHGINEELIKLYEDRLEKKEATDEDIMELGWCYLQNEMTGKGVSLLEGRAMEEKYCAEYHNLLSKCYFMEDRIREAAEEARECIPCIEREANARQAEADGDDGKKEQDKIPGRIAGACEIIAKAMHVLAKEGGISQEEQDSRWKEALEAIETALEKEPDNRGYRIEKAQIFMDQGAYERAMDVCDEMIRADRNDFYAYVLMQKCCYELHNGQGVVDNFYNAKEIYAGYPEIYELAADVFLRFSQYDDARGILKQAREANTGSPKLDVLELQIERETAEKEEEYRKAYDRAQELLKKFKEHRESVSDETLAMLYYETARCCRGLDRQQEALKNIQKACGLHMDKLYRWIRANTLADLKEYDKAIEDYLVCSREYGENEVVYENMARCYENMGNKRKAVYYFKKTLEVNRENPRANSRIVDILTDMLKDTGNLDYYKEALPFADRQIEITPTAYYYIERGLLHMEAGAWDPAEEDFVKAAELEPENAYAYNNRGCIYKYREEYDKALELFARAAEVMEDRETLLPFGNSGGCYERMGDYPKAVEWYQKGSDLFPKNKSVKRDLIRVYKKMNLLEKAMEAVRELYDGQGVDYYLETGEIYVQMKRYNKALSMYAHAERLDKTESSVWSHKAEVYLYYKKNIKKALEFYKKALELSPKEYGSYDRICRDIMECYYELGTPEEGLPYQKLIFDYWTSKYGSVDNYLNNYYYKKPRMYFMGAIYYYLGDLEKAREYFDQIGPAEKCRNCHSMECEDYWEAMGFLEEQKGNLEEAINCYRKAYRESPSNNTSISKAEELMKKSKKHGSRQN